MHNNSAHANRESGWAKMAGSHPLLGYIDNSLRGCGQVIFMNNPLTGVLNFLAMFWGAYAGDIALAVAIGSVAGTFVSTAAAYSLRVDRGELRMGLYGFNGMLVGAAIPTFIHDTTLMWVTLAFASAASTIVAKGVNNVFGLWKMPSLTFPFVLTTWLVVLAAHSLPDLQVTVLQPVSLLSRAGRDAFDMREFIRASLVSVSQVYLVDNPVSGAIFLFALAVESRRCAGLAAFGAIASVACALAMNADMDMISHGLWGYSAVLTAPAIGYALMKTSPRTLVYCAAATVFAVFAQGALDTLTRTLGIPVLTFPFVLTTWIFVLGQRKFTPTIRG
jgi:urea transporter